MRMKIGDALVRYYATHGLPADGGEHSAWFRVRIGPLSIPLPNPPARRKAVFLHDVNHVVTGYNTVFSDGKMSIAAFEVAAGCGRVWIAWFINLSVMAFGVFVRPRASFHAFVRGRRSASIYRRPETRTDIRQMTVAELRALLMVDGPDRPSSALDRFQFFVWCGLAIVTAVTPPAVIVAAAWSALAA